MLKLLRNRKGQGLVEYALIIAGVTLLCAVGITMFGHKVAGMIDMVAVVLPGAHDDCNGPIANGQLIETTKDANGNLVVDTTTIAADKGTSRGCPRTSGARATAGEWLVPDTAGGL